MPAAALETDFAHPLALSPSLVQLRCYAVLISLFDSGWRMRCLRQRQIKPYRTANRTAQTFIVDTLWQRAQVCVASLMVLLFFLAVVEQRNVSSATSFPRSCVINVERVVGRRRFGEAAHRSVKGRYLVNTCAKEAAYPKFFAGHYLDCLTGIFARARHS